MATKYFCFFFKIFNSFLCLRATKSKTRTEPLLLKYPSRYFPKRLLRLPSRRHAPYSLSKCQIAHLILRRRCLSAGRLLKISRVDIHGLCTSMHYCHVLSTSTSVSTTALAYVMTSTVATKLLLWSWWAVRSNMPLLPTSVICDVTTQLHHISGWIFLWVSDNLVNFLHELDQMIVRLFVCLDVQHL